jgi:hypothetical protein
MKTWRAVLVTQALGVLFAVTPWLEQWGRPTQPHLSFRLAEQSLTALLVMLAAFAGDELVRRGWTVLRAFATTLICACAATALTQWTLDHLLEVADSYDGLGRLLKTFFNVGAYWGTPLLVYLNRQSATRLLATVRVGELRRVEAERRLVESHLTAAQAQINPAAVLQQLAHTRDLYAAGSEDADRGLELLIADLRDTVARCAQMPAERSASLP